jgi:hypothetical protein
MQHTRKGTRRLAMMRVVCELENTVSAKEQVSGALHRHRKRHMLVCWASSCKPGS